VGKVGNSYRKSADNEMGAIQLDNLDKCRESLRKNDHILNIFTLKSTKLQKYNFGHMKDKL
jgi:hypothetical protein